MDYGNEVKNIIGILLKNMEKNENAIKTVLQRINEVEKYSQTTRELYIKDIDDEIVHNDLDCIRKLFVTNTPSIDDIYYGSNHNNDADSELKSYNLDLLF